MEISITGNRNYYNLDNTNEKNSLLAVISFAVNHVIAAQTPKALLIYQSY